MPGSLRMTFYFLIHSFFLLVPNIQKGNVPVSDILGDNFTSGSCQSKSSSPLAVFMFLNSMVSDC